MFKPATFLLPLAVSFLLNADPVRADWSDDFALGTTYTGIQTVGHLGARKNFALPRTSGRWVLQVMDSATAPHGAPLGDLVFTELVEGKPSALLTVRASLRPTQGSWKDECPRSAPPGVLHHDRYPDVSTGTREKCLLIEAAPSSLNDLEKQALAKLLPDPAIFHPVRANFSMNSARHGYLRISVVALPTKANAGDKFNADFLAWAKLYANTLEDALSKDLEPEHIVRAIPIAVASPTRVAANNNAAGNTAASASPTASRASAEREEVMATLQRLKGLLDMGVINSEEYDRKKQELLKRL